MADSFDWRILSDQEMETHFNPRVTVDDPAVEIARFTRKSVEAQGNMVVYPEVCNLFL